MVLLLLLLAVLVMVVVMGRWHVLRPISQAMRGVAGEEGLLGGLARVLLVVGAMHARWWFWLLFALDTQSLDGVAIQDGLLGHLSIFTTHETAIISIMA